MSSSNYAVLDNPTEKVSIKQTEINEVLFKKILNSLFKTNKKVQADIQVPVPLQSVKSQFTKTDGITVVQHFYTMHLDAVVLAGYSKHVLLYLSVGFTFLERPAGASLCV